MLIAEVAQVPLWSSIVLAVFGLALLVFFIYFPPPSANGWILRVAVSLASGFAAAGIAGTLSVTGAINLGIGTVQIQSAAGLAVFVLVLLLYREGTPTPTLNDPGIDVGWDDNVTFSTGADMIRRAFDGSVSLTGFSSDELSTLLKRGAYRFENPDQAFSKLGGLATDPIRPYGVSHDGLHYELKIKESNG